MTTCLRLSRPADGSPSSSSGSSAMWPAHAFRNHFLAQHAMVLVQPGSCGTNSSWWVSRTMAPAHSECGGESSLRFHGLWLLGATCRWMLDTPTSRLVSDTSVRLRSLVDKWFTVHTVHSSQFTPSSAPLFRPSPSRALLPQGPAVAVLRPRLLLAGPPRYHRSRWCNSRAFSLAFSAERTSKYSTTTDVLAVGTY